MSRLADVLSDGALRPGNEAKRFEIAVLLTLLGGIEQRLAALGEYTVSRDLIASDRQQVATYRRHDGSGIEVYYDQAILPPAITLGARDRGVMHYLGSSGRLRPDITVRVRSSSGREVYTVFEIKLSDDVGHAASGYAEAIVYRHGVDLDAANPNTSTLPVATVAALTSSSLMGSSGDVSLALVMRYTARSSDSTAKWR